MICFDKFNNFAFVHFVCDSKLVPISRSFSFFDATKIVLIIFNAKNGSFGNDWLQILTIIMKKKNELGIQLELIDVEKNCAILLIIQKVHVRSELRLFYTL